jgi:hypothetical protein
MQIKSLVDQRFTFLIPKKRLEGNYYQCLCDCGKITICHANNLRNGNSKSCGCLRSKCKLNENNPGWKGDKVGYMGLHGWIRKRYKKPLLCENCHTIPPLDLANKSNKYLRDLNDWWYLCRKCHMKLDGRIDRLRASAHARLGIPKKLWKVW